VARKFQRIPFKAVNPYTAECEYFADCILQGRAPAMNNAKNSLHLMSLVENAYGSSKARRLMPV